jgi:hypothetical protein
MLALSEEGFHAPNPPHRKLVLQRLELELVEVVLEQDHAHCAGG